MNLDLGSGGFAVLGAILGIWGLVGFVFYLWYLWALSKLFPYLGLPSSHGWIPFWNQWQLINRAGLPGWVVLLAIVPGLVVVGIIVSIMAIHRLNREFGKDASYTVLGAFLPPIWAMLLASHIADGVYAGASVYTGEAAFPPLSPARTATAWPEPVAPGSQPASASLSAAASARVPQAPGASQAPPATAPFAAPPLGAAAPAAAAPAAAAPSAPSQAGAAVAPQGFPQPQVYPQPQGAVQPQGADGVSPAAWQGLPPVQPGALPSAGAEAAGTDIGGARVPGAAADPAVPGADSDFLRDPHAMNDWGFSRTTEGNFERLAAEQIAERPAAPLGMRTAPEPFAWPGDARPVPAGPSEPAVPSVPATPSVSGAPAVPSVPGVPSGAAAPASPSGGAPDAHGAPAVPGAPAAFEDPAAFEAPAAAGSEAHAAGVPDVGAPAVSPAAIEVPGPAVPGAPERLVEPALPAVAGVPAAVEDAAPVAYPGAPSTPEAVLADPAPATPAVDVAPATPGAAAAPAAAAPSAAGPAAEFAHPAPAHEPVDDDFEDHTVLVSAPVRWALELPDGDTLELLGDDVVVGRKPAPIDGSEVLALADPTRTVSKSHVRLRFDGELWTVEDLNSTNGLASVGDAGVLTPLATGQVQVAPERMVLGTLEVILRQL